MNMRTDRRNVIKTTGAMATLLSLGIVTTAQAQAAGRAAFEAKTLQDAIKAIGCLLYTSDAADE